MSSPQSTTVKISIKNKRISRYKLKLYRKATLRGLYIYSSIITTQTLASFRFPFVKILSKYSLTTTFTSQ